ncbi:MAG: N-acetyltransferase [Halobacteriovoraceae bacterium]|mgnify:CR=1 FL=1|jgi:acetyltransferase-like isoleucine patch superfamily enzyme|nr:N-acetyltransferase [Halobacteriovoraceae bacterium]MBT5094750.1 N-acetyltransferase [Halobacteriovoraceae bacterium]
MENCNFISDDVELGKDVRLTKFLNLYGCKIGDGSQIGPFVEIQKKATIGCRCKISSHTFICEGVFIGDESFIGHGVVFVNDNHPRAVADNGELEKDADWKGRFVETHIGKRVSIGSNSTILGGLSIADGALVGAGSVVTKNIGKNEIWAGVPAKKIGNR